MSHEDMWAVGLFEEGCIRQFVSAYLQLKTTDVLYRLQKIWGGTVRKQRGRQTESNHKFGHYIQNVKET